MMFNVRLLGLFRPCSDVKVSARYHGRKRYYSSRGGEIDLTRGALKCRYLWQHGTTFVSPPPPPPPPFSGTRATLLTLRNASNETSALSGSWRTQKNHLNQPGKYQQQWKRRITSVPEQPLTGSSYSDGRGGCCSLTEESSKSVSTKGPLKPRDNDIASVDIESTQRMKEMYEEYKLYEAAKKNPRMASEQVERSQRMTIMPQTTKSLAMLRTIPGLMLINTKATLLFLLEVLRHPRVLKDYLIKAQQHLVEFVRHYVLGSKLLWSEIKTARKITARITQGHHMTRRERKQLLRTVMDIFRMVPLAAFLIIPFMDFLLPVAVKLFPGMLPSTFQDVSKEEEMMKKELHLRIAYARFLQEAVTVMADKKMNRANDEVTVAELTEFIEKAKLEEITNQDIYKFARMFEDELTLDNISRSGLVNMCRYMRLPGFGSDSFLRFQLRSKHRSITQDDQRILWEGVTSLTKRELQDACRERGMRATGLTKQGYARQLSQWLELRTKESVPISLLIMSRAFTLQAPAPSTALAQSISAMDASVITEVMIDTASGQERDTPGHRSKQLESWTRQNKLIDQESKNIDMAEEEDEMKRTDVAWEKTGKSQVALDAQDMETTEAQRKEMEPSWASAIGEIAIGALGAIGLPSLTPHFTDGSKAARDYRRVLLSKYSVEEDKLAFVTKTLEQEAGQRRMS